MKTISRLLLSSVLALAVLTGCSEKPTETVATAAVVAAPIPVGTRKQKKVKKIKKTKKKRKK